MSEMQSDLLRETNSDDGAGAIFVDCGKLLSIEQTSWESLFGGYDELRAVVFSTDISFLKDLLELFRKAVVIVGCPALMGNKIRKIVAQQRYVFEQTDEDEYLVKRIRDGSLRLAVTDNGLVSHQKVYLMSSADGRCRVVTGSANVSRRAWDGSQLENYTVFDGDPFAYDAFCDRFDTLLEASTDDITIKHIEAFDRKKKQGTNTPVDAVPLIEKVKRTKHSVVLELDHEDEPFQTALVTADETFKDYVPAKAPKKNGVALVDSEFVERIAANRREVLKAHREMRGKNAEFTIDYQAGTFWYNGSQLDTTPAASDVQADLRLVERYFAGFDRFAGDVEKMKRDYCRALTWMFASPFIPYLRLQAYRAGYGNYDSLFPSYLFISGASNAGKSRFVETVQKLMHGQVGPILHGDDFKWAKLAGLQMSLHGLTVVVEEMNPSKFSQAKKYVKDESFLVREGKIDHPTFVILSNDMRGGLKPDIAKRMMYLEITNNISADDGAKQEKPIKQIRDRMDDALYRAYLPQMFEKVQTLCAEMSAEHTGGWIPDVFAASSDCLIELMSACDVHIDGMAHFTWYDCCGDKPHAAAACEIVRDMVRFNSRAVVVDRKHDTVRFDLSIFEDWGERREKTARLKNGLPLSVEDVGGSIVVHDIARLEEIAGVRFPMRMKFRRKRG